MMKMFLITIQVVVWNFFRTVNPTITFEASVEALQSQVFIKYGGEPWRRKQYSNAQVGIIERETRDILGEYAEYSNSDRPALHF